MTKNVELKLLARVIRKFGPKSYVGPWLGALENDLRWAIKNDIPIDTVLKIKKEKCW